MIEDLASQFEETHNESDDRKKVLGYSRYYLGSIIISTGTSPPSIIDGQQRLTTLMLMLIYLKHKIEESEEKTELTKLIYSRKSGDYSFNVDVEDRSLCLQNLLDGISDSTYESESASNLQARYGDISTNFPEFSEEKLVYFADWLRYCVDIVLIKTDSEERAYTIFETTNDRGLSLSSSDMLKGYLLSRVSSKQDKQRINEVWKQQVDNLRDVLGDGYSYFFREWLRSKYALTSRTGGGSTQGDYEEIGKSFHKWVRDKRSQVGLTSSASICKYVESDFKNISNRYIQIRKAAESLDDDYMYVYCNDWNSFTSQYPLIISVINPTDSDTVFKAKTRVISCFADMFVVHRGINHRRWAQSSVRQTMFSLMKELRDISTEEPKYIAKYLRRYIEKANSNPFQDFESFSLRMNRNFVGYFLARITAFIETRSGMDNKIGEYLSLRNVNYDVEHVIPDRYKDHQKGYANEYEFQETRNRIGGLLLLPSKFNRSYGAKLYVEKLSHYNGQNLLARSFHQGAYANNPGFLKFVRDTNLPFKHYDKFGKDELSERQKLYQRIAEMLWDPQRIIDESETCP